MKITNLGHKVNHQGQEYMSSYTVIFFVLFQTQKWPTNASSHFLKPVVSRNSRIPKTNHPMMRSISL